MSGYIDLPQEAEKVAATKDYFSEIIAALKTGEECARLQRLENGRLVAQIDRLRVTLTATEEALRDAESDRLTYGRALEMVARRRGLGDALTLDAARDTAGESLDRVAEDVANRTTRRAAARVEVPHDR